MSYQFTAGRFSAEDALGAPLAGGRLYTYEAGTTTFKSTYTNSAATVPSTYTADGVGGQYIALNARGEAEVWLGDGNYKLVLQDSLGVPIWTTDGLTSSGRASGGSGAAITTNRTLTAADNGDRLDVTAAVTLTPATPAALGDGWSVQIHAIGFPVIVNGLYNDGSTTKTINAGSSAELSTNGTTFRLARFSTEAGPAFSASASANQTVVSGVFTRIAANTELYDTNARYDAPNGRFTPNIPGYYAVKGTLRATAASGLAIVTVSLYKNGLEFHRGQELNITGMNSAQVVYVGDVYLNGTTDYIELFGGVTGTTPSFNVASAGATSWFSAHLARSA